MKDLPKYHETFVPILKILYEETSLPSREMTRQVIEKYYADLPGELRQKKTKSGTNLLSDRIGWGKSYLKMGNFVTYPARAKVAITAKGRKIVEEQKGLTLQDLQNDPDFLQYRESVRKKKDSATEDSTLSIENGSPQDLIDEGVDAIEEEVKAELLEKLKDTDPYFFEKVVLELLKKMGYGDFIETARSRDGGIDGIINEDKLGLEKIYIQAKRFRENKVREPDIRNFIGAMSGDTRKGVFFTTSTYDNGAIQKAREAHHTIILIDGAQLVDLMHQYNVGVQEKMIYEIKEIDHDFFEGE